MDLRRLGSGGCVEESAEGGGPEARGRAQVRGPGSGLGDESGSEEDEELRRHGETAGYVYHRAPPGSPPALHGDPYMCVPCSRGFPTPELLVAHVESHLAQGAAVEEEGGGSANPPAPPPPSRPFSCHVCGRLFTQRGTMTRHLRGHLGLKPFACEQCGMRFTRHYRKTEHMRVHARATPFQCRLCGVRFAQQRSVASHLKAHAVAS